MMHSMQNVRSGGFCPPDPPSKKWGIAPNVVCWCMPKTLKVMASAYVLLSVENLKLCHQTIPSQKNRKMKHQVLQILTHPSTKKVYQGSILSLGKGSCWVNVGCRSCESHACQCARCNCVQKRVVHGTKGGVLVNAQTLKVRDSAYVLLRVENL